MLRLPTLTVPQPIAWRHLLDRSLPIVTIGFVFVIYLQTLAPTIFAWDSAELTTGAYTLGIVHAPGYSVYMLIAHLFTYLPWGDVAYRVNLLSAVATTIALTALLHFLRPLIPQRWARLVAVLTLAFSFHVWSLSVFAEVYTVQMLFLMLLLLCLQRWRAQGRPTAILCAAWLLGVAMANSPIAVLWLPGALYLTYTTPHFATHFAHWRMWLKAIGMGSLGLAFLLYLPLRSAAHPALHYAGEWDANVVFHPLDLTDIRNLIWYLSGRQFDFAFGSYTARQLWAEVPRFLYHLSSSFLGVGIPLGIWGAWALWRTQRAWFWGLLGMLLPYTAFFIAYNVHDKETMFLPTYLIWAIWLAVGLAQLRLPPRWTWLGFALPLVLLVGNWSYVDLSGYWERAQSAETQLLNSNPNALILTRWSDASSMEYHQIVHGVRRDVRVINLFLVPSAEILDELHTHRRALDGGGSADVTEQQFP